MNILRRKRRSYKDFQHIEFPFSNHSTDLSHHVLLCSACESSYGTSAGPDQRGIGITAGVPVSFSLRSYACCRKNPLESAKNCAIIIKIERIKIKAKKKFQIIPITVTVCPRL